MASLAYGQETNSTVGAEARVSFDVTDMDITQAMKMLSDATGYNIILSQQVTGKMTAYFVDIEPERALREAIEVNGYRYVKEDNVVWVLTDEEYFEDRNLGRERIVIPLVHARAQDVALVIADNLSRNAKLQAYPETNVLVVAEEPNRLIALRELVGELDTPPVAQVFQLENAAAPDMLLLLQPYVTVQDALRADLRTNQVVAMGTEATLARIGRLLKEFDKPDKVSTEVFPLKYANAEATANLLEEVLTGRKGSSGSGVFGSQGGPQERQPTVFTTEPGRGRAANPLETWRNRQAPSPTAPGQPTETIATPTASVPTATGSELSQTETVALGPLANVTADSRTNSVIVTHVESVLARIAQIIAAIDIPGEYHTYQFRNANPEEIDVAGKLTGLLTGEDTFLQVDALSRKVTFRAPADKADEILLLLGEWDQVVRQVRIEAEILRVNASLVRELGITWRAVKLGQDAVLGEVVNAQVDVSFPANVGQTAPQGRFTIGNIATSDYTAVLQALEDDNDTEVIALPKILVRDNSEAIFSSARDEPYTVVTVDGNTQTTLEDVRFLNVGVSLGVLARIHANDVVTLDTQLEISNLVDIRDNVPVVDRATAQSSVSVENGGTILLGGLRQRARTNVETGLPGLRRIPVVGALFRNRLRDRTEFEILLVLRPFIVGYTQDGAPGIAAVSEEVSSSLKSRELGEATTQAQ
jgi:type II secretory pathway component GspD/PulD (secretin)